MKYTVDIHGEINEQLIDDVVLKLRSIYDYNEYQLDTFVSPMELYEEIELDIDTPGGLVTGFMQIRKEVDKLKNQGVEVNTFVSGTAYSCGFLLTLLGTKRDSDELGSFLYHRGGCQLGYDKVDSNARFLEHQKTILDKVDNFIIENNTFKIETSSVQHIIFYSYLRHCKNIFKVNCDVVYGEYKLQGDEKYL